MKIELKKFGTLLISRPAGREAFATAKAYIFPQAIKDNEIIIDFAGVDVLSPSWADEFITGLKNLFGKCKIIYQNTENPSVKETLATLSALT